MLQNQQYDVVVQGYCEMCVASLTESVGLFKLYVSPPLKKGKIMEQ